jgi:hypothetical protein
MLNQLAALNVSVWQMVIDLCLVTAILVMAFRFARSSRAHLLLPRIVELEGRIGLLMAETEGRAKHITEQLIRREQGIAKHVAEIERREKDIGLTLSEGEALAKELSLICEGARREAVELERIVAEARAQGEHFRGATRDRERASERRAASRSEGEDYIRGDICEDLNEGFVAERASARGRTPQRSAAEEGSTSTQQGERSRGALKDLQASYRAAEGMLKEGRAAGEVAERTNIPIEGVERLAQMIEIERLDGDRGGQRYGVPLKSTADPRLGALGFSRR